MMLFSTAATTAQDIDGRRRLILEPLW